MISEAVRNYIYNELKLEPIILTTPSYDNSIIGITIDGKLVYDFNKMIDEIIQDKHLQSLEEAINIINEFTLKYISELDINTRPIIMQNNGDFYANFK